MSIANIFCQDSAAYLVTDSGYFWPDGRLAALGCKVLELPRLSAALTTRGHVRAREHLAPLIRAARPKSTGELLTVLPELLRCALDHEGAYASDEATATMATEITLAFWCSERRMPGGAILASTRTSLPSWYEPFSWIPVREATSPGVSVEEAVGRSADPTNPATFDPVMDGMLVAQAQRHSSWQFNDVAAGHHASGRVRLTKVTEGVTSTITIGHWRDRIGLRIEV